MAKRYARVNWQNRPSVATPISATNLNKMDKGIDDVDNAIEEILDDLSSHLAENVNSKEVHGLRIERGIWTPIMVPSDGSFSNLVYDQQRAIYEKIGKTVFIRLAISSSLISAGDASGAIEIQGLPFTPDEYTSLSIGLLSNFNFPDGFHDVYAYTDTAKIALVGRVGNNRRSVLVDDLRITAHAGWFNHRIYISGTYKTT